MRIMLKVTSGGYRLEGYDNDKRNRVPLAVRTYPELPILVTPEVQKARIMDMMTRTAVEYARQHGAQRYTAITGGE